MEVTITKEKLLLIEDMLEGIRRRIFRIAWKSETGGEKVWRGEHDGVDWIKGMEDGISEIEKALSLPVSDMWERDVRERGKKREKEYRYHVNSLAFEGAMAKDMYRIMTLLEGRKEDKN